MTQSARPEKETLHPTVDGHVGPMPLHGKAWPKDIQGEGTFGSSEEYLSNFDHLESLTWECIGPQVYRSLKTWTLSAGLQQSKTNSGSHTDECVEEQDGTCTIP